MNIEVCMRIRYVRGPHFLRSYISNDNNIHFKDMSVLSTVSVCVCEMLLNSTCFLLCHHLCLCFGFPAHICTVIGTDLDHFDLEFFQ